MNQFDTTPSKANVITADLNPAQRAAVLKTDGPVRILARSR